MLCRQLIKEKRESDCLCKQELNKTFLKYNLLIKYKKESEMAVDFLSRKAIETGIFSGNWNLEQEQEEFC
jgi:hypothetical protein